MEAPVVSINPVLLKLARFTADGAAARSLQKQADPMPPAAPPQAAAGGMAPADPTGGGGIDPAIQQAIQQAVMAAGGGGAGGPMGKGKSPKDQINQGQMKILIHMVAQLCQKQGIQVDPMLLVPMTDPNTDQMAMQEMQGASMTPSNDPNAPDPSMAQGGAGAGGGGMAPPPVQPMSADQGPIGGAGGQGAPKAASYLAAIAAADDELPLGLGQEWAMPDFDRIVHGAQGTSKVAARARQLLVGGAA